MRLTKWPVPTLAIVAIIVAGGWLAAGDDAVLDSAQDVPETSAMSALLPAPGQTRAQWHGSEQSPIANFPSPARMEQRETPSLHLESVQPGIPKPQPPQAVPEPLGGRYADRPAFGRQSWYMPRWYPTPDITGGHNRDARRSPYRQQRDYYGQRDGNWLDTFCPWPKSRRNRSARRGYERQIEPLDRRGYRDTYMSPPPFGYPSPAGW